MLLSSFLREDTKRRNRNLPVSREQIEGRIERLKFKATGGLSPDLQEAVNEEIQKDELELQHHFGNA